MNIDVNIDACKQGEQEALGNLYKAYSGRLMRICLHYVTDRSTAEDILHDAFIIIFTSIKTLKDDSKLERWMITIVRNLSLKYLQCTEKDEISLSYLGIDIPDKGHDEKTNVELELLLSAIESLPEGNREVFKLSVLDGLSHKEIGELLGINPHSSSSQLFRAKKMLRAILINYWMLLLLPILIPIYIYFATRDKSVGNSDYKTTAENAHKHKSRIAKKAGDALKIKQPVYSAPSSTNNDDRNLWAETIAHTERSYQQIKADSVKATARTMTINMDSLQKYLATGVGMEDSLRHLQQISENKMMALNEGTTLHISHKKKHPWTFNFGYSSNPSGNNMSNLNYLSVVDYANGGAAAKIYSLNEYIDYLDRNRTMMDSTENARLRQMAINQYTSADHSIGEKIHHYRPQTYSLSLNKQLTPRWTFGTGLTYTRLKSEFESPFNDAALKKTQKIDYIGIPLRMTYSVWNKGRFNAYATGGVTFEMPVHTSLTKDFVITTDSSFTMKGTVHPHYQWSVNVGVGIQYRIFKPFSFYLEPNMFYYFSNGSGIETYRTEHPFTFSIPFGLRLTW